MKRYLLGLIIIFSFIASSAQAQTVATAGVSPIATLAKQAIVVEAKTGDVLYEKEADTKMPTSSMSKVMTMYIVFEAIKNGKLSLTTMVPISNNSWKQVGSRTFLKAGTEVPAEDLIRGLIIQSGNDSSVALAEAVAGSEARFTELMNDKAKEMGLTNTHFNNATGLPDPDHYSTARDLSVLALHLMRDFPEYYHYYSETEFTYNDIKQGNRNPLLYRNMGVDGMKTGHTDIAGYGLIATALRDGRRILVVVNGLSSKQERADEPAKLIEWAYREYGLYTFINAAEKVTDVKIWLGMEPSVPVAPALSVELSLPRNVKDDIKVEMSVNAETQAPIEKGQTLGKAVVSGGGITPIEVPLVAMERVEILGPIAALWAKFKRAINKE